MPVYKDKTMVHGMSWFAMRTGRARIGRSASVVSTLRKMLRIGNGLSCSRIRAIWI